MGVHPSLFLGISWAYQIILLAKPSGWNCVVTLLKLKCPLAHLPDVWNTNIWSPTYARNRILPCSRAYDLHL